jgi:hypothetical protein
MSNPFDPVDEGYNPFAGGYADDAPPAPAPVAPPPAASSPFRDPDPAPSPAPSSAPAPSKPGIRSALTGDKFVDPVTGVPISERDIIAREEALARRERDISTMEDQVRSGTYVAPTTRNNFPPFLKWWAYYPNEDLPENARSDAKLLFWAYTAGFIPYAINVIGALGVQFTSGAGTAADTSTGMLLALSIFFLVVWQLLGYECFYFLYYKALIQGKGLKFICSLVTFVIWWGMLVFNVIGVKDGGSVGIMIVADLQGKFNGCFTIGLIFVLVGLADAAALAYLFVRLVQFYRREGLSKKAFAEAGQFAAEQAAANRETLVGVAMEHPEVVSNIAASGGVYG